jgi:hypothetical protein
MSVTGAWAFPFVGLNPISVMNSNADWASFFCESYAAVSGAAISSAMGRPENLFSTPLFFSFAIVFGG